MFALYAILIYNMIAYVKHSFGGAAQTLAYAEKRKKEIIQLYDILQLSRLN